MRQPRRIGAALVVVMVSLVGAPAVASGESIEIPYFFAQPEAGARGWVNKLDPSGGYVPVPVPQASDPPADQTAAGTHPNLSIFVRYCNSDDGVDARFGCTATQNTRPKDFLLRLPPGMLGNPSNVDACMSALFILSACPDSSRIGTSAASARVLGATGVRQFSKVETDIYNVETFGLEPALFGTERLPASPTGPFRIKVSLRTEDDFGIDSFLSPMPKQLGGTQAAVFEQRITLFGAVGGKPFLSNPTSCSPATTRLEVTSWENPETPDIAESRLDPGKASSTFTPDDCELVTFRPGSPDFTITPDSTRAGEPTGYATEISQNDSELDPIHESHLKDATITLPDGVSIAAAAGRELEGCTEQQFGLGNNNPAGCPAGSRVANVTVETPILAQPLSGRAFFAQPAAPGQATDASPWKLYLLIEGAGLRIKLSGDITVSDSGRITARFRNLPQTPFTKFELRFNGGNRALLANPRTCGPHAAQTTFVGWSNIDAIGNAVQHPAPAFTPAPCPDPEPFQPSITTSADDDAAGAGSARRFVIERPDGHSLIRQLTLALPPGLAGSLNTIPLCSAADARAGTCGDSSRVGSLNVTVGFGGAVLRTAGSLYLAQATGPGDLATLVAVIPAKAGPIDLGLVVLLSHVRFRGSDGSLTVISEEIPTILGGVPLPVRRLEINVDRKRFLTNPTGCNPRLLQGTFVSDRGAVARASTTYTAKSCDRLAFSPRLRMIVRGGRSNTKRNTHPAFTAIVTQDEGEAHIRRSVVTLPDPLRPDTVNLNRPGALCSAVQLAQNACPARSLVGRAQVTTPLLAQPLSGPVFLVVEPANPLPTLVVQLRGLVSIDLVSKNRFRGIRMLSTFDNLPDLPQSRFELNLKGGEAGILKNFVDLCDRTARGDAVFTAHSGRVFTSRPRLETNSCRTTLGRFSIRSRRVQVNRRGVARIRVRCPKGARCGGRIRVERRGGSRSAKRKRRVSVKRYGSSRRFSIRAGRTRRVRVKLNRSGFRLVQKRRRLPAWVKGRWSRRSEVTRRITLRAPKRKRRSRH